MKKINWIQALALFAIVSTLLASVIGVMGYWYFSRGLPELVTAQDYHPLTVTRIYARDGLIGEFYKERRYLVPYESIPERVVQAFISAEDDQFFEHSGFNMVSILRASIANFKAGHVVQGGSTITQQVAKSLLLSSERSFIRKAKELILASRMEKNLDKKQILYLYLNQIYLGHGAYGVEAAAKVYFGKELKEITVAEAALLAGLPQAPSKYSPFLSPKRAKERQIYVLRRMQEGRYISAAQYSEASTQPVRLQSTEELNTKYSGTYVEHVRRYLVEKYGDKTVYEEGLTVQVPVSAKLLQTASRSLKEGLRTVDKRVGWRGVAQKLKTDVEIEKFLRDYREKMILKKTRFQILNAEGKLDSQAALIAAGFKADEEILEPNAIEMAVVTSLDERRKTAGVLIGAVHADLPLDKMKWARPARDDKNPDLSRPEPSSLARVLARGDVIWVKVLEKGAKGVVVGLEQEPLIQGALFSMETKTGIVLAMEGGYDFEKSEFNRVIQAQRQPGSAFKPIIYACALENGYTPASIIVDSPIVYEDAESGKWKPTNFEEKFYGDTTFRQALIKSRNIPTIKIVQALQVGNVIQFARRLGHTGALNADLSISLGSGSASLYDMTREYALLPRMGRKVQPLFISSVRNRDGKVLEEASPKPLPAEVKIPPLPAPSASAVPSAPQNAGILGRFPIPMPVYPPADDPDQVLDPRVAYVMTNLMKEVVTYGTGHEAKNLNRPAAGKTGTTNEYIDAWFIGFTPQVITGVWVGFDNLRSIGPSETGARAALPIWLSFMQEAVQGYPNTDFAVPPGVVFSSIDANTGKLAPSRLSSAIREAFIEGTEPREYSSGSAAGGSGGSRGGDAGEYFKEELE